MCDGACGSVKIDDNECGALLARHLIERGHKKFGTLSSRGVPQAQNLRRQGFIEAIQDSGEVVWDASANRYDQDLGEALSTAARKLGFSALFCSNDILAITRINELSNAGISIPNQPSIVGFDDIDCCEVVRPCLTTVRQPYEMMGKVAVQILMDRVFKPDAVLRSEALPVRLIERKSR